MVVTHGTFPRAGRPSALTVGNFDGVHRGHRSLLERLSTRARELDADPAVLTFEPHPREFLRPASAPARITRLRDKLELLREAGIRRVHVARFDARFAALSPGQFIDEVVVRGMRARWLTVGRDFRYGSGRAGDFSQLEEAGRREGFRLEAMEDVLEAGERVSSSAIRAALQAGDFARVERLLGRPYAISGRVAHGRKLGRELGFPTANIVLRREPPLSGIHVVWVDGLGGGVASLGRRPTVNPLPVPLLEVHLFDRADELYGRLLRVRFLHKLRDEEKYDDLETLREAIALDARNARAFLDRHRHDLPALHG